MSLINRAVKQGVPPAPAKPAEVAKTEQPRAESLEQHIEQAPAAVVNQEQDIRLAVCVPCRDMIHTTFSHNLHSLLQYNWQKALRPKCSIT